MTSDNPMTPPDSVGKVVELLEEARVEFAGHPSSGIMRRVITRLQALDRQRQEEVLPKSWWVDRLKQQEALTDAAITRAEAAEAALAEARELLQQIKQFGGWKAGALDAFLTRTAKEPSNA